MMYDATDCDVPLTRPEDTRWLRERYVAELAKLRSDQWVLRYLEREIERRVGTPCS